MDAGEIKERKSEIKRGGGIKIKIKLKGSELPLLNKKVARLTGFAQ